MINQRYQKPGNWSIDLKPETPRSFLNRINVRDAGVGFSQYCVTPVHIEPKDYSWTDMKSFLRYSGIYTSQENDLLTLSGTGAICYLGDEGGLGPVYTKDIRIPARSFTHWISNYVLQTGGNGIATGTVTGDGITTHTGTIRAGDTRRDVLETVCQKFDRSWRLNPDLTLDANSNTALYREDPNVITMEDIWGKEVTIYGLKAKVIDKNVSLEDFTAKTIVTPSGKLWQSAATAELAQNPYYNPNGGALSRERWLQANRSHTTAACQKIASRIQGKYDQPLTKLDLEVEEYDIGKYIEPGDMIYVYDPESRLFSMDNTEYYMGREVHPKKMKVFGIEWGAAEGWGHYLRIYNTDTSAFEVIDLTDWVEPEDPIANIEVGYKYRKLKQSPVDDGAP